MPGYVSNLNWKHWKFLLVLQHEALAMARGLVNFLALTKILIGLCYNTDCSGSSIYALNVPIIWETGEAGDRTPTACLQGKWFIFICFVIFNYFNFHMNLVDDSHEISSLIFCEEKNYDLCFYGSVLDKAFFFLSYPIIHSSTLQWHFCKQNQSKSLCAVLVNFAN